MSPDIAIIGMSCVFPGARNLRQYWQNILNSVDAVSDAPPDWEAERFYDPDSATGDKTYCKRGGFLGGLAAFDPARYGVMPNSVDGTEPDHFLALAAASDALADAGYENPGQYRERTAVIIGRGTYVNRGNATALQHGLLLDTVTDIIKRLHAEYTDAELAELRQCLKQSLPAFNADTAPGLVPNIISGRIANRLDLMGPNFVVDAACASSLIAVDLAMRDLRSGRCDMAIAGGVHASTPPVIMIIFSQLNALSRKGAIRPFDAEADGTLLGEGVGMAVLKRLADAERDGDRIYAVLKSVGTASDGRALGLLAPRIEGEEAAIRRAYEEAGFDPRTVALVEAHGTATPVGDATEMQALNNVFGERAGGPPHIALGSVKSMISHTMPAAGMAGLIKTALALHHKVLPPTIHCENPSPSLRLATSRFYLNTATRPWIHSAVHPRRAGVNAFGFGGINAHAVMEEYVGRRGNLQLGTSGTATWGRSPTCPATSAHNEGRSEPCPTWLRLQESGADWDAELFVVSADSRAELPDEALRLSDFISRAPEDIALKDLAFSQNIRRHGSIRLAIVATGLDDLKAKLARAVQRLKDPKTRRIREIEGIYWFSEPLAQSGKLAFLYPGEGAQYPEMLADLCIHFPEVREWFDRMDRAFRGHPRGYLPSEVIFPPPGHPNARLFDMDAGAEAVFCANQALHALMARLGIRPDALAGHSTGEHTALLAAGVMSPSTEDELASHILGVNGIFERLSSGSGIAQGVLATVAGASHAEIERMVDAHEGRIHIALDNCPHQVVLWGEAADIEPGLDRLTAGGAICQKLPFARAYHTPRFAEFAEEMRRYFDTIPVSAPKVPLWSCATAERFPDDPSAARHLASIPWARTVRFRETIDAMYRDGVRIFVEVGPRGNLTSFLDDILRGRAHAAIAANLQSRSGLAQIQHMVAQLIAHGVPVRLERLYEDRAPQNVFDRVDEMPRRLMKVASGLQPARLPSNFSLKQSPAAPPQPASGSRQSAVALHLKTMEQFLALQQNVMGAYLQSRRPPVALPFIGEVVERHVNDSVRAIYRFNSSDKLFADHSLGRNVSVDDPELRGLSLAPLAVSMEILAEGAALLMPGHVVTGMRDLRAHRWITLEKPEVAIEILARRQNEPDRVKVEIREVASGDQRPVLAEATVLLAAQYASAPPPAISLENEPRSKWDSSRLYQDGMFHGPALQATNSMDRSGRSGASATLIVPDRSDILSSTSRRLGVKNSPNFVLDPIILDNAGQVVAFWSQEILQPEGDIFPYSLEALDCFAPPQPPGTRFECRVRPTHVTDREIHSDIEIVDSAGRVHYRFTDWADRRFLLPRPWWRLRVAPWEAFLSEPWHDPIRVFSHDNRLACRRLESPGPELLESSHGIWLKVLAYGILSRSERSNWESMTSVPARKIEWLLGRCTAKDAVRTLVARHFGEALAPADVIIEPDPNGKPVVSGAWTKRLGVQPVVSITHSKGCAAALAALTEAQLVGIDLEARSRPADSFASVAFSRDELNLLAVDGCGSGEWPLRLWCAKEAVSKCFGHGLGDAIASVRVRRLDVESGRVDVCLRGALLDRLPEFRDRTITAYTVQDHSYVYSSVVYNHEALQ